MFNKVKGVGLRLGVVGVHQGKEVAGKWRQPYWKNNKKVIFLKSTELYFYLVS